MTQLDPDTDTDRQAELREADRVMNWSLLMLDIAERLQHHALRLRSEDLHQEERDEASAQKKRGRKRIHSCCIVCQAPHAALGLCANHYQTYRRAQQLLNKLDRRRQELQEIIEAAKKGRAARAQEEARAL